MVEYPAQLAREHQLVDGRAVTIRPMRHEDEAAELEFLRGLSGDSLHARFMKWIASPPEKLAHYFADIDYQRHMAFVCAVKSGAGAAVRERLVGEARYVVNPDGESCEFGVVVADTWRKSGIAGLLMEALIRTARTRGLKRMESTVLRTNSAMLRFARGLGFEVQPVADDPTTMSIIKPL
jgi:acetyltransferase